MIKVEMGTERKGEVYIWCAECSAAGRRRDEGGCMFEGNSPEALMAFLIEHWRHDSEEPS